MFQTSEGESWTKRLHIQTPLRERKHVHPRTDPHGGKLDVPPRCWNVLRAIFTCLPSNEHDSLEQTVAIILWITGTRTPPMMKFASSSLSYSVSPIPSSFAVPKNPIVENYITFCPSGNLADYFRTTKKVDLGEEKILPFLETARGGADPGTEISFLPRTNHGAKRRRRKMGGEEAMTPSSTLLSPKLPPPSSVWGHFCPNLTLRETWL